MHRSRVLLVAAMSTALVVMVAADGPAGREGQADARKDQAKPRLYGEQGKIADVVGMSNEQRTKIAELNVAREKEIREVFLKYQAMITDVMTVEQKAKWNEHVVLTTAERMFQKANLTEAQIEKIKQAAPAMAPADTIFDEKTRHEMTRKLGDLVTRQLLTEEQKAAMRSNAPKREPDRPSEVRKDGERKDEEQPTTGQSKLPPL